MGPDFSGYATKVGLKCSDGRVIMKEAFAHMDGKKVPLVWQHSKNDPTNVLGHALLSAREDGVYCEAFFNDTEKAKHARTLVQHEDIDQLSIFANQLIEKSKQVFHGVIHEVSLVMAGANPGARIDNIAIRHSDGEVEELPDEAVITTGLQFEHATEGESKEDDSDDGDDDDDDDETVQDVINTMSPKQREVMEYVVGVAAEGASSSNDKEDDSVEQSASDDNDDEDNLNHQEGNTDMTTRNVFEQGTDQSGPTLTHDQLQTIVDDAKKMGSWKDSLLSHAQEYGIGEIELLFPDAKAVTETPDFVKRRTEWVAGVITNTKHSPFARIKSLFADITADEARAKGYLKGSMKKEEFFGLAQRTTTPTTVYKKQKLDRDDIIDITEMDVVRWLWMEMRLLLDEELAGAILVGDGRQVDDPDKVKDPSGASSGAGIRSIANDDEFYAPVVEFDSSVEGWNPDDLIVSVADAMVDYEGSGSPTFYGTTRMINKILFQKDTLGRRLYTSRAEIASAMGVSSIVDVPETVMSRAAGVAGIIVNLQDYTVGTNAGGEISRFDDFDIDYNQYKYLLEGRCSGALTKYHSAVVLKDTAAPGTGTMNRVGGSTLATGSTTKEASATETTSKTSSK